MQADEEFKLIKGLAESIRENKKPKENNQISAVEMFGKYVTESLSELEPRMRHIAQHYISEILFNAQMGTLGQTHITNNNHQMYYQQNMQQNMQQDPNQQINWSQLLNQ